MFEVYIHVPFCLRRCGYCDFNTYTATDLGAGASRGNYANMVIREMKLTKQWQLDHGIEEPPVSTVFFGGGTPTIRRRQCGEQGWAALQRGSDLRRSGGEP